MLIKTINITLGVLVALSAGSVAILLAFAAWHAFSAGAAAVCHLLQP